MRVQDQPAYILHHRPFRDSSQIIDVLTPGYGRLSLMSRGSRGAKSRLKSLLQPFTPLIVSWSGKGDLPNLSSAEAQQGKVLHLAGKALPSAFYINELLIRLLHQHDINEEVYALYEAVLKLLAQAQAQVQTQALEPVLRLFEKQLLESLGFGLNLSISAQTQLPVEAEQEYAYYLEHGPVEFSLVQDESYLTRLQGSSLLALHNNALLTEQALRESKRLMRGVVNYYLQGKPLKSRELFR